MSGWAAVGERTVNTGCRLDVGNAQRGLRHTEDRLIGGPALGGDDLALAVVDDEHAAGLELGSLHADGVEHGRQHRPVGADHDRLPAVHQLVDEAQHLLGGGVLLAEPVGGGQRPPRNLGVRRQGLHAAGAAGADQGPRVVRRQEGRQPARLGQAQHEERPQPVVLPPRLARARLGVTQDHQGPGVLGERLGLVHRGAVVVVGHQLLGLGPGDPPDPVDLGVGPIAADVVAADHAAGPVVHGLHPGPPHGIALVGQPRAEPDLQTGLLEHLAHRGGRDRLTPVQLPLGKGPVVVARAMHQQDVAALAGDDGACSLDVRTLSHADSQASRPSALTHTVSGSGAASGCCSRRTPRRRPSRHRRSSG